MKTVAFFNNKGGVGKTSLVYHLSWMFSLTGINTVCVDLDPQANLTAMFLNEDVLEKLWEDGHAPKSIYGAVSPILRGTGDILSPEMQKINSHLSLVPGNLALSHFEDELSDAWPRCNDGKEASFRTATAFYRAIKQAAPNPDDLVLIDVGPNLGAINRSAIIASDYVVFPLSPDLFSLQGLKNLGPTLREWRKGWDERKKKAPSSLAIPEGRMQPVGYIVVQHSVRADRPVKAYQRWLDRIPGVFREDVLGSNEFPPSPEKDPYCIALLKHYRSLMPLAMDARKPMFLLKPADGAIGAQTKAVTDCGQDFLLMSKRIAEKIGVIFPGLPSPPLFDSKNYS